MKEKTDLFAKDSLGRTSLFHAAETGNIEEVKMMIFSVGGTGLSCQRLALIKIRDSRGLTVIEAAANSGHREIADLLLNEQMRMEFFE